MPKRLAITIAGAVSLGSYEAGVLYEICEALRQHNTDPATPDAEKIYIDVITGASAGGMTAVIAAQKLLFEAGSLASAYDNSFYRPWVKDISIDALLNYLDGDVPTHSLLSSRLIDSIARKHLLGRYGGVADPQVDPHPTALGEIRLGLALGNLNGISYSRDVRPNKQAFVYTRYQDILNKTLGPGSDVESIWEKLVPAVCATGAFPFAFAPREFSRMLSEYDPTYLVKFPEGQRFTYTDGGVFQNEPLGLAKQLVDEVVHADPAAGADERYYLFVCPHPLAATSNSELNESNAVLGKTAAAVISAFYNQARFHDWIAAESINDRIGLFNTHARGLQQLFQNGTLTDGTVAPITSAILPLLFPNSARETQAEAWSRVKSQWEPEYISLAAQRSQQVADVWIDTILLLETAAGLGAKDEMIIYGITAENKELAGSDAFAFLGFFDRAYRDHDYDLGRTKARNFIDLINQGEQPDAINNGRSIGPIRYASRPEIHAIDKNLDDLKMASVPAPLRQAFEKRLRARSHDLMADLGIKNPLEREAIELAVVGPLLRKYLNL